MFKTLKNNTSKDLQPIIEKPPQKKNSLFTITESSNLNGLNRKKTIKINKINFLYKWKARIIQKVIRFQSIPH